MSTVTQLHASGVEKLVQVLDRTLSKDTGIIKKLNIVKLQADEPPVYIAMAEFVEGTKLPPRRINTDRWQEISKEMIATGNLFDHMKEVAVHSSGAALDEISALWATVGEAYERYAMTLQIEGNEVFAKASELNHPAIEVDDLVLFDQEQYAKADFLFKPYNTDKTIRWGLAVCLQTGEDVYLPADIYSPYYPTPLTDGPAAYSVE